MSCENYRFTFPERVVVSAAGKPIDQFEEPSFLIQVRQNSVLSTVKCLKTQLQVLADSIDSGLDGVRKLYQKSLYVPESATVPDPLPSLEAPFVPEFEVGTVVMGWNPDLAKMVITLFRTPSADEVDPAIDQMLVQALTEDLGWGESYGEENKGLEIHLSPLAARRFAALARAVIADGREQCPQCGLPIDPKGHICPKANGYSTDLFSKLVLKNFS